MKLSKHILPISTGLLFIFLLSLTVGVLFYYSPMYVDNLKKMRKLQAAITEQAIDDANIGD